MRYIREDLAGDLGGQVQFDIICGTSVGAIHSCFFAATADMADRQGRMLVDRWESFVLEEMVTFGVKEFMRAPATLLGSGHIEEVDGDRRLGGVVQTQQLERIVRRLIPWQRIGENMRAGHLESLSVTATDIGSGKSVVFVQNASGQIPRVEQGPVRARADGDDGRRARAGVRGAAHPVPRHRGRRALLLRRRPAPEHAAVARAAPGRRQGAGHRPAPQAPRQAADVPEESMPFPGAAFLVGKILDAFLLDHIDYDLDRLRRFNALIEAVRAAGSPDHRERFDQVVTTMRGAPYRVVGEYMIRPSEDLGEIAGAHRAHRPVQGLGRRRRHPAAAPAGDGARRRRGRPAVVHPVRRLLRRRGGAHRLRGRARAPRRPGEVPRRRGRAASSAVDATASRTERRTSAT